MVDETNTIPVQRYWFLTWTTYGTWLPGDERGYVGNASDETGRRVKHNVFGTPTAPPNRRLREAVHRNLKAPPVVLTANEADLLLKQFQETTQIRGWLLIAAAIMRTHLHLIVAVADDPDPEKILGDLKSYGSRRLNQVQSTPAVNGRWTQGGSKRKLADEFAVEAAVNYIRQQPNPLLIWTRESGFVHRLVE